MPREKESRQKKSKRSRHKSKSPSVASKKSKPTEICDNNRNDSEEIEVTSNNRDSVLSVAETNKLRTKLGLAPLKMDNEEKQTDNKQTEDEGLITWEEGTGTGGLTEDVHAPAESWTDKVRSDRMKEKIEMNREKRERLKKLDSVKGLGEADSHDEASSWVERSRKIQKEKEKALLRAKEQEAMDKEYEDLAIKNSHKKAYKPRNLKGLTVEHDIRAFKEGKTVILTLKDSNILSSYNSEADKVDGDVLINQNMLDDEIVAKSNVMKKLVARGTEGFYQSLPDYATLEDPEMDEELMLLLSEQNQASGVLQKYDSEIEGEGKKKFTLNAAGSYSGEREMKLQKLKESLRKGAISLESDQLKVASDFMTEEEMNTKFKKRQRRVKSVRDDILRKNDVISLSSSVKCEPAVPSKEINISIPLSIGINKVNDIERELPNTAMDIEDVIETVVINETDEAEDELSKALLNIRKMNRTNKITTKNTPLTDNFLLTNNDVDKTYNEGVIAKDSSIIFNSTREFCRNIGTTLTAVSEDTYFNHEEVILEQQRKIQEIPKKEEKVTILRDRHKQTEVLKNEAVLEHEATPKQKKSKWQKIDNEHGTDKLKQKSSSSHNDHNIANDDDASLPQLPSIIEEEPMINNLGLSTCIQLAKKKGYLNNGKSNFDFGTNVASLASKNFVKEEIRFDDIDAKFSKQDRFSHGPIRDFEDKNNYKPIVKLDYKDEFGRNMSMKEAFQYLSHRFHGKGSGMKKSERRLKKIQKEMCMNNMESSDTPLGTVDKLHRKLQKEGKHFVVLSGKSFDVTKK